MLDEDIDMEHAFAGPFCGYCYGRSHARCVCLPLQEQIDAEMDAGAPASCDEHGYPRRRRVTAGGLDGYEYECGCLWGSDDGRGEDWQPR